MRSLHALSFAKRLVLVLLLAGLAIKPALAASEELHDLIAHATLSGDGHSHDAPAGEAPDDNDAKGGQPHDDGHLHLTHCCSHQAAVPARVQFQWHAMHGPSPLDRERIAFAPAPRAAPFRPPIAA
jgi:hypothetical protein